MFMTSTMSKSTQVGRRLLGCCILLSATSMRSFSASAALPPKVDVNHKTNLIQISPAAGESAVKCSMILLHGLGDTAQGWAGAAHEMVTHIDGLRVVLPTAPSQPVTMNGGYKMPSWYDIKGLDDRSNEDCDGLEDTRKFVMGLIDKEVPLSVPAPVPAPVPLPVSVPVVLPVALPVPVPQHHIHSHTYAHYFHQGGSVPRREDHPRRLQPGRCREPVHGAAAQR